MYDSYQLVNWFKEGLEKFYGDNNNGLVHGIYHLDDEGNVVDVSWFRSKQGRASAIPKS